MARTELSWNPLYFINLVYHAPQEYRTGGITVKG